MTSYVVVRINLNCFGFANIRQQANSSNQGLVLSRADQSQALIRFQLMGFGNTSQHLTRYSLPGQSPATLLLTWLTSNAFTKFAYHVISSIVILLETVGSA